MVRNDYELAIREIKRLLKAQNIHYAQFAAEVGMSVSGLKKVFGARDGSFARLSQMAQALGVGLAEILEKSREATTAVDFTDAQIAAFEKEKGLFPFYWSLVYERMAVDAISTERKISRDQTGSYLRTLAKVGLIRLVEKSKVRIPDVRPVAWVGKSEFVSELYRIWGGDIVEKSNRGRGERGTQFLLRYLQMTEKTYQEFLAAQRNLESEFLRRSIVEMRKSREALNHVRWLACTDQRRFFPPRER